MSDLPALVRLVQWWKAAPGRRFEIESDDDTSFRFASVFLVECPAADAPKSNRVMIYGQPVDDRDWQTKSYDSVEALIHGVLDRWVELYGSTDKTENP